MGRSEAANSLLSRFGGREGFTINEILISVALIAIGVLGLSLNTIGVFRGGYLSSNVTAATFVAQAKIEELRGLGGALPSCPSGTTPGCFDGPLNSQGGTASSGAVFNRSWVISHSTPQAGLSKVDVTVSWTDYMSRQVVVSTLVFTG